MARREIILKDEREVLFFVDMLADYAARYVDVDVRCLDMKSLDFKVIFTSTSRIRSIGRRYVQLVLSECLGALGQEDSLCVFVFACGDLVLSDDASTSEKCNNGGIIYVFHEARVEAAKAGTELSKLVENKSMVTCGERCL